MTFALFCASLFLVLPASPPVQAAGADVEVVAGKIGERLDGYLGRLAKLGFSGSALVARGDEMLLAKGYGLADPGAGVPHTPRTVISLGSITKHFTAAAVLRLEMDGLLSVQDTLDVFFEDVPEDKRGITLHHLLSHSSGLPAYSGVVGGSTTRDELVRNVLATDLEARPGREFIYSNMGFTLLAAVLEIAFGKDYDELVEELLFGPAGMHRSGLASELWEPGDLAHGIIDGRDDGDLLSGGQVRGWDIRGAGGLHSTVYDMLRWTRALEAGTVLSDAALEKLVTPHVPMAPGAGYGYGTGVHKTERGTRRIGHSGSNDVFCTLLAWYPDEGVTIYVQTNDADVYAEDVSPVLERIVFGGQVTPPPQVIELDSERLEAYAGTWKLESGGTIEVAAEPGRLLMASEDVVGAGLVHPVRPSQAPRRDALLGQLAEAFERAFEGDLQGLHRLIDPSAPFEEFAELQARRLDRWTTDLGQALSARCFSGRNRFGEIAIVVALAFEQGEQRIEYSFGGHEVGSIRTLAEAPARVLRPISPQRFVAYDIDTGESWGATFRLTGDGRPEALVLVDEGGKEHVAIR